MATIESAVVPLAVVFAVLLAIGLAVGFGVIGHHGHGPLQGFNHRVDSWFPTHRYHLAGASVWIATLFDVSVLGPVCILVGVAMWVRGASLARALVPVVAPLGAEALVFVLKAAVDERRPTAHRVLRDTGLAFPSGHSTAGTALVVALAGLAAARRRTAWPWLVALLVSVAVMASRLIVGVHWFGDVTVGAVLGAAWGLAVLRYLQPHPASSALSPSTR